MDSIRITLCLSFVYSLIGCCMARSKLSEVAYLYEFQPCPNFPVSSDFKASYVYGGKDDFRVSMEITVNKTYEKVEALFDASKCTSREKTDCERLLSFPMADYCSFQTAVGDWNTILDRFKPPIKCPLKGHYVFNDFPISEAIPSVKKFLGIGLLSTDNPIYNSRLILKYKDDYILCLDLMGSFRLMRTKN